LWKDVAEAIARILTDPGTVGRTYELVGPGVYTLRELVSMTLRLTGKRRLLIPVPFAVAEIQARLFELLPNPPLTTGRGVEAYPLHGHQTDNVSVITLASVADLSCAFSSSNTIKSNSASVIPSGRQILTPLAT
jgi:uncharacterized protein YbjT (DUF2867 family)